MTEDAPLTVHDAFTRAVARHGARPFLAVLPETAARLGIAAGETSYQDAAAAVARLADAWQEAGYGRGHRVGLLLENRPALLLIWLALNRLGVSVVPINPDLRAAELEYLVVHAELAAAVAITARTADLRAAAAAVSCRLAVVEPSAPPPPAPLPPSQAGPPDADTECALLYSSGTTGRPKGCVLANDYFLAAGRWYTTAGGLIAMAPGTERLLTPLPLFHMNALAFSVIAMVMTGGCLIVLDRFHPSSWWPAVRDSGATILHYLGVMPAILMGAPASASDRAHAVRFGFGAGVPHALHAPFEARFGFPLIEAWAMTETGAGAVVAAHREPRHIGTNCFGRPDPAIETLVVAHDGSAAAIDQPGELLVRRAGPVPAAGFFRRYEKDPDATAAAWEGGWFHTGDVVRRGADGSLHFVDRKKNVIRRSGENISAVEVETVLLRHPAVRDVAVAATPDALRGDEVIACVVPAEPVGDRASQARLAAELAAWCRERLAYYKAPGWVAFVDGLPMTTTQKIERGALTDVVASLMAAGAAVDLRALKQRNARAEPGTGDGE